MNKRRVVSHWWWVAALFILPLMLSVAPVLAISNSTTLPNGADLSVSIDSPISGTEFLADGAPVPVTVSGTASIGIGDPQATIVYIFDASGSTLGGSFACGDVLTCEKSFFTQLNTAAANSGSVNQIGLVAFGNDAKTADMTPAGGDDPLGEPADGNTVINSIALFNGGFNYRIVQYTLKDNGDADGTNYTAALQQAVAVLDASSDPAKFVIMASDGLSNSGAAGFAAALAALDATGARIDTIAIATSCTGGSAGDLADVAGNGGSCTVVTDPNDLPNLIPNLIGSTLTKVEMSVDAGAPVVLTTVPPTPQPGPVAVTYTTQTAGLNPGLHAICVTAFGTDVTGGSANVTVCVRVEVFDLTLTPATAINELGSDNQHTVTATLLGPAGSVSGYLVTFAVGGQNVGATGTCAPVTCLTDASGVVTFTYSVPIAPASLGNDTITASVTLANPTGATDTETVTKSWVDTTPPVASCVETVNPSGNKTPPAGTTTPPGTSTNGPLNPDEYYQLNATDDVWPAASLQVFVIDTGSGTVFGPYPVGTNIMYTEAPGATPTAMPIGSSTGQAGAVSVHIIGTGDAAIYAVDGSGNVSARVSCLVPPPPQ